MTFTLVLSPAAKNDLKEIYQHRLHQWGYSQSNRYLETLKKRLWSLIEQPHIGIERPELIRGIRSFPVNSHIIFLQNNNQKH